MFKGSLSSPSIAFLQGLVREWGISDLWNGCSGNFTIARSLPGMTHHGNDVTLYSSAIGWWACGQDVPVTLKPESEEALGWLQPYLDTPARTVTTVLLATRFLASVGLDNAYHRRNVHAYRSQWERLHAGTLRKVDGSSIRLASYASKDVLEWLVDDVPADAPVACIPPLAGGGNGTTWAALEKHLDWPAPRHAVLREEERKSLIHHVTDRPRWFMALNTQPPELATYLRGSIQPYLLAVPLYLYAPSDLRLTVGPIQQIESVSAARLAPETVLTGTERVTLARLTNPEFQWLRAQYLDVRITPALPAFSFAVLLDGMIAGCVAFKQSDSRYGAHSFYMLSDFPVAPTQYKRLSVLIAKAAQSVEVKQSLERISSLRANEIVTTAFTDNIVSMKYRSAGLTLIRRQPSPDGKHAHQIEYRADTGRWTLQEAYEDWYKKHSDKATGGQE